MKRSNGRLISLLAALTLLFSSISGALAADKSTEQVMDPGGYTFTYTLDFDAIAQPYASAQFDITISNKNELDITSISFNSSIKSKADGTVNTIASGGDVTGNQVLYQAGFLSARNQYGNEASICTITFSYTGSTPQMVTFDNLQIWRLTGEVQDGIPELQKEVPDWSRTIHVSRSTSPPSGGGSSGGGAGSGTGTGSTGEVQPVENKTTGNTTTVSVVITGTMDASTGKTTGTVGVDTMLELITNAKRAEGAGQKAVVEIKLETTEQTKSVEVSIPRTAFKQLAGETNADVKISTGIGSITFDAKAVRGINAAQNAEDISVSMAKVDPSVLPDAVKQEVGDRPVYDFSVTAGSSIITSFGGGSASISVPYTLRPGEDKNAVIVYYLDASGNLQVVRGAYNEAAGTVDFKVSHFSQYVVGYNKVRFADVAQSAWYSEAVSFIAARGITKGTAPDRFSPDAVITRGQFIVMLMRAYGIEPDQNPTDNFADAGNTYYTNYLAAAKRLGISMGVGDNRFAPESEITRQDLFTLLYRSLKLLDELPENTTGRSLAMFGDASEISNYAMEAMDTLVKGGIVNGSAGMLDPQGKSIRAQMAQVLFNLLSA